MSYQYILFDLDGTLTDSSEGITKSVQYALETMGEEVPSREKLLEFIGPPLVVGFQTVTGLSEEKAEEASKNYRKRYSVEGLFENRVYDGIEDVLKELKKQGKYIAVATSKPEPYSVRILEHFGIADYFDVITGSGLDGSLNTKAKVIAETLKRLKCTEKRDSVLMIGDRWHDIAGAKECGIHSLGVGYGFAKPGELQEAGADAYAETVSDILNYV